MPRTTGLGVVDISLPRVGVLIELSVSHPGSIFCSIKINNWNLISCLTILTLLLWCSICKSWRVSKITAISIKLIIILSTITAGLWNILLQFIRICWILKMPDRNKKKQTKPPTTGVHTSYRGLAVAAQCPSSEEMISHLLLCSQEEVITSLVESCAS